MANIKVTSPVPVYDGQPLTFRSPADCSAISGLIVHYHDGKVATSKTFQFADAHGNNVGDYDLFAADALVKVILDTDTSLAFVQNADTNAYLEGRFKKLQSWELLAEFNTAGAYTFVVPDDVDELGVFVLGGGSSGAASTDENRIVYGGASGGLRQFVLKKSSGGFTEGEEMPVVVGAGGKGKTLTKTETEISSSAGGTSSFNGIVSGSGQPADVPYVGLTLPAPYGLVEYMSSVLDYTMIFTPVRGASYGYRGRNIFDPNDRHIYCGAGGSAVRASTQTMYQTTVSREKGSAGAGSNTIAGNATAPGDGGGAAAGPLANAPTSGNGADGLVLVYGRKVV